MNKKRLKKIVWTVSLTLNIVLAVLVGVSLILPFEDPSGVWNPLLWPLTVGALVATGASFAVSRGKKATAAAFLLLIDVLAGTVLYTLS